MINRARLRSLRLNRRPPLSIRQTAKIAGVSASTYSGWEDGTHEPRISGLAKLAEFYGVTVDFFLSPDSDRPRASR